MVVVVVAGRDTERRHEWTHGRVEEEEEGRGGVEQETVYMYSWPAGRRARHWTSVSL